MDNLKRLLQPNHGRLRSRFDDAGFTLTEIALALAIFSFALVSMLGLLSVGMKNSRKANIQLAASNTLSGIAADIQSSVRTLNAQDNTYKFVSPRLAIATEIDIVTRTVESVTINSGSAAIVDESCSTVSDSGVTLMKQFAVRLSPAASGTPAVRVTLDWPPRRSASTSAEGSLNALIPLPLP
ncbi:MAG: prepilin-type N-terminal cleavage/methylation domain-containing protein [Verrucomicrobia bacterium]|nr:prepilin-type N-terminal cleavage/methylation domain-containing protein [Verrucomicrobiota bacterium]